MLSIKTLYSILALCLILLLAYIFIKLKIEQRKNIFFIGTLFYMRIIIIITDIFFAITYNGSFPIFITLVWILAYYKNIIFLSVGYKDLKGLFFKYRYTDINNISIKNYPEYTNGMLVIITLNNKKHKKFKIKYNSNIIPSLISTNVPITNTFKNVNEL